MFIPKGGVPKMYKEKILPAEEALAAIKKGSRVFMGSGCGEPQYLVDKLGEQVETLFDVEIIQVLSVRGSGLGTAERLGEHFSIKTFFIVGGSAREAVWAGRAEYTPIFMSQVPKLFSEKLLALDCALVQVSPPNAQGYMSLGIAVDVAHEAVAAADLVIAQVNPAMPVTLGNSFIHISDVDTIVEYEEPILEVQDPDLTDTDRLIGVNAAGLVEDEATIHAGLGPLPKAALQAMKDKKDLGVHTDMLTNSYLDLIRRGVITNRKKEVNPNRIVASYCVGSKELFDFVHLNPFVEFQPISYTNDPFLMGQHGNMTTIHEAWEADLTGLVCAAGHGHKIHSGVGGLVDFMRGAYRSKKGKCIIAINAAGPDERESRILPALTPGSAVMAGRAGTQYVVTQFGSANLHGKSLRERAVALIEIAHPKFREELYNQALNEGLLSHGEPISLFKPVLYPQDLEKRVEIQGESLLFRPARASDL
ncbi:MAG: acetyl-CoA hydrolase/transferase C-terminal domain-containing protein, partial [Thermodesulfobacteriota bacterium]|nr:acetyl-CoA hydrolase/transferase C-terminal domain-containing protein [Thermodesulfobacteriota bacterium]